MKNPSPLPHPRNQAHSKRHHQPRDHLLNCHPTPLQDCHTQTSSQCRPSRPIQHLPPTLQIVLLAWNEIRLFPIHLIMPNLPKMWKKVWPCTPPTNQENPSPVLPSRNRCHGTSTHNPHQKMLHHSHHWSLHQVHWRMHPWRCRCPEHCSFHPWWHHLSPWSSHHPHKWPRNQICQLINQGTHPNLQDPPHHHHCLSSCWKWSNRMSQSNHQGHSCQDYPEIRKLGPLSQHSYLGNKIHQIHIHPIFTLWTSIWIWF